MTKAFGGDSRASRRVVWAHLQLVLALALATATFYKVSWSAESTSSMEQRIQAIIPESKRTSKAA